MRIKTTGSGPAYLLVSILLVAGFLGGSAGIRAEQNDAGVNSVPNPGAELWRAVRERQEPLPPGQLPERPSTPGFVSDLSQTLLQAQGSEALSTQVKGVDAPVLINSFGEDWRRFRMEQLIPFGGYLLAGVLAVILVFALVRGRVRIDGGYSGKRLRRFTDFERVLHWFLASVFVFLAVSGLILLFGRAALLPLMGPEAFAVLASACKEGHNLFGPIFLVALVVLFFHFVRQNLYRRGDLGWLLRGGGMLGVHASAGYFNMGEKIWFWLVVLGGLALSVSGFTLLFPNLGQGRQIMELALMVHALAALGLIVVAFGHIYLGTFGTEGTLQSMTTGYVDLNWGRSHHDGWAKECEEQGQVLDPEDIVWKPRQSETEAS
jgi:formate dehydrogenase subunit gamma